MDKTILYLVRDLVRVILLSLTLLSPLSALAGYHDSLMDYDFESVHMILALLTSGIFVSVLVLVLLIHFQVRRLHSMNAQKLAGNNSFLDCLPSLLSLEKILFQLLTIGFVFLTILIVSGMLFAEQLWHQRLFLSHKIVFTLLAWAVFGVLLFGRYVWGWRGQKAINMTIFGFTLLFLSYVGTHFILDVVLESTF